MLPASRESVYRVLSLSRRNLCRNLSTLGETRKRQYSVMAGFRRPCRYANFPRGNVRKEPTLLFRRALHVDNVASCWNCNAQHSYDKSFFCGACGSIAHPQLSESCTYFDLLDVPASFDINVRDMERRFWKLQMSTHPDKFSLASDAEKEYSDILSSRINHAYNVLRSPLSRAQYLLEMNGIMDLSEGGNSEVDPALLMEIMEAREELDATTDVEKLEKMKEEVTMDLSRVEELLAESFDAGNLEEATRLAVRLRYITTLFEEIEEKLHQ